jgi:probable rRNA maturation factor
VAWKNLPVSSLIEIDVQVDDDYSPFVDEENLRAVAAATLAAFAVSEAELVLVITSDELVQALNRDYRGIDAPTDVLSFAAQEGQKENGLTLPPELAAELNRYLGDIIIAYPYTMQQAAHFGTSPAAELRLMVVHGVLHLLVHDHDSPEAEAAMWARQEAILAQFGDQGLSHRHYDQHDEQHD